MENENVSIRLELLERSVEQLLTGYNALQQEKSVLKAQVDSKTAEINALQQTITELKEDKNSTLQRVSGLLSSIETWEESQTTPDEVNAPLIEKEEHAGDEISATLGDPQMSIIR